MPKRVPVAFLGATPIPVGHRVRVTYFERVEESVGFFGGSRSDSEPVDAPRVEDLTSGVIFGHLTHYAHGAIHPGRVNVEDLSLAGTLEVGHVIEGTVRACEVITVGFEQRDVSHHETHLVVEVD